MSLVLSILKGALSDLAEALSKLELRSIRNQDSSKKRHAVLVQA